MKFILVKKCYHNAPEVINFAFFSLRIARSKCKEYEMDNTKNKTMQWFDNPDF